MSMKHELVITNFGTSSLYTTNDIFRESKEGTQTPLSFSEGVLISHSDPFLKGKYLFGMYGGLSPYLDSLKVSLVVQSELVPEFLTVFISILPILFRQYCEQVKSCPAVETTSGVPSSLALDILTKVAVSWFPHSKTAKAEKIIQK